MSSYIRKTKNTSGKRAYLVRLGGAGTGLPFVFVARRIWTGAVLERLVNRALPPPPPPPLLFALSDRL